MSEHETAAIVRQAYESVKRGDMPSFLSLLASEVEWWLPEMEQVPFAGAWRGREGVAKFFETLARTQGIEEFEPEKFIAQGDEVVVLGHFVMLVKATGRKSSSKWAHVWTVNRGEVTAFREYVDTAAVSAAHRQR